MQKFYSKGSRRIVLFDSTTNALYQSKYINDRLQKGNKLFDATALSLDSLISSGMLSPYSEATSKLSV